MVKAGFVTSVPAISSVYAIFTLPSQSTSNTFFLSVSDVPLPIMKAEVSFVTLYFPITCWQAPIAIVDCPSV